MLAWEWSKFNGQVEFWALVRTWKGGASHCWKGNHDRRNRKEVAQQWDVWWSLITRGLIARVVFDTLYGGNET